MGLATRCCAHAAWVYVDTTPFYALVRYSGAGVGLAAVYHIYYRQQEASAYGGTYQRRLSQLVQLTLGLLLGELGARARPLVPRDIPFLFYGLQLALSALSVISIVIVPYYVSTTMYSSANDNKFKK